MNLESFFEWKLATWNDDLVFLANDRKDLWSVLDPMILVSTVIGIFNSFAVSSSFLFKSNHSFRRLKCNEYLVSSPTYEPREIIEIDEWGDIEGEVLGEFDTPDWAKIKIKKDKFTLKRRMVNTLPAEIKYRKLKKK